MTRKLLFIVPATIIVLAVGSWWAINNQIRTQVDNRLAMLVATGEYSRLEYESLTLALDGDITMQNLHVVDAIGNEYVLEDILLTDFDYRNDIPHHLALSARGLRFPAGFPEFGNTPNVALNNYLVTVMEADFLPLEFNYQYNYLPEESQRLDSSFNIVLPNSFLLATESQMRNVSLQQLDSNALAPGPDAYSMLMENADVPFISITVEDLGVVNAMMAIQGEEYGVDAERFRQQLDAQLQAMAMFAPQQMQGLAQQYVAQFSEFLEGGKTLSIAIRPEYEGNIQRLQSEIMGSFFIGDFQSIVEVLHLEIDTR